MASAAAAPAEKPRGGGSSSKMKEPFSASKKPPLELAVNPIAWLLWTLDVLLWTVSVVGPIKWVQNMWNMLGGRQLSRVVGPAERSSALCPEGVVTISRCPDEPEVATVHDLMQRNFRKFGHLKGFGTREYLGEHTKEGSRFPLKMFGETHWLTYKEVQQRAKAFGCGLRKLGLQPQPADSEFEKLSAGHSLLLWEDTCADWMTALVAAGGQSIAVATSYATLGVGAVVEAVNQVGCKVVVCNYGQVTELLKLKEKCGVLETIIYTKLNVEPSKRDQSPVAAGQSTNGLQVISFDDVVALGEKNPVDYSAPQPSTVSVIMYTSGSTGTPKGVVMQHGSFVASIAALKEWVKTTKGMSLDGGESYVAYLPAAHILELTAEHAMMSIGAEIGFADPRTITSRGACRRCPDGRISTEPGWPYPPGALQEFRPSLMAGVPKIWDIFKKAVEEKIGNASPVVRFIFSVAFVGRANALAQGRESPLFKALFSKVVQGMVGGRLKVGLTGGGPCSSDVQTFIRTTFAVPFVQGYALTETCCGGTIQNLDDNRDGVVGSPFASVQVRLNDCPEVVDHGGKPYLATDTVHNGIPCNGRGEVWIAGPSLSAGYFKEPKKTSEEYVMHDKKRWFRTGDIACWTPDGCLRIVDRLKNLVKLKGGEYVAIEHMESTYGTSIIVDAINGGVMCYGDGDMDRPVAFVQIVPKQIESFAKSEGMSYNSVEELCENPKVEQWVMQQLNAIGKKQGLQSLELLVGVRLFAGTGDKVRSGGVQRHDPWTPDNQMLTATNKLNRKPIQAAYSALLAAVKKTAIRN
eukprot:TRINITY_DN3239_c0_g1_i1.p1 TRINITY_DN3239_c0_g1~~TRINITY_DN3239_c0_g1_i1.p1  ORF type:complete len:805 (-),score=230.94 TRINITY_DN3239_c0_g1_i1:792-3206(-)